MSRNERDLPVSKNLREVQRGLSMAQNGVDIAQSNLDGLHQDPNFIDYMERSLGFPKSPEPAKEIKPRRKSSKRAPKAPRIEQPVSEPLKDGQQIHSEENGGDISKENEDLEPIHIPLVDPSILDTIKRYKDGGVATIVNDRIFRYMVDKCGLSEEEAKRKKPEEALELISERIVDDFKTYMLEVGDRASKKLEKAGLKPAYHYKSPFDTSGEEDKNTPRAKFEQISGLLWKGARENERAKVEPKFRELENAFFEANIRTNGIENLKKYLVLNGIGDFDEINQKNVVELAQYFSETLKDLESEAAKKFQEEPYNDVVGDKSVNDYTTQVIDFIKKVDELSKNGEIDQFDSFEDIQDFIEKMRLVAVDDNDLINKLAKRFHEAASKVAHEAATKAAADEAEAKVVVDEAAAKASVDKLQADRESAQKKLGEKKNKKGLWGRLKFWKKDNKNKKDTKADNTVSEPDKKEDGDEDKDDGNKKQREQTILLRFVGNPIANLALAATAITGVGLGAYAVTHQHSGESSNNCNIHDISLGDGNNISNSFNCKNIVKSASDNVGQINRSGDLNQLDAKKILDRADGSYDGIITFKTDSNHNYDGSFKQVFAPLGADDDELGKLKNYAISHQGTGQGANEIKLNTFDREQNFVADVLILGARASDTKLPDTTDVTGLVKDDSISLIGLMESQGQRSQEIKVIGSLTPTATFTATAESVKSPTFTATATKDATASVSGTAAPKATETPSVDVQTKTPQTSSEIKKSQRDAVKASLDFNERFTGSNLSLMAPMFLAAGPIIEIGSGLKFLNSVDDEEDDEEKKETKSKKTRESK